MLLHSPRSLQLPAAFYDCQFRLSVVCQHSVTQKRKHFKYQYYLRIRLQVFPTTWMVDPSLLDGLLSMALLWLLLFSVNNLIQRPSPRLSISLILFKSLCMQLKTMGFSLSEALQLYILVQTVPDNVFVGMFQKMCEIGDLINMQKSLLLLGINLIIMFMSHLGY